MTTEAHDGPLLPIDYLPKHIGRKTLVLDLDETLAHSNFKRVENPDLTIGLDFQGRKFPVFVMVRPGIKKLLTMAADLYETVLFTASVGTYANAVMDKIDPENCLTYRLYRDSCVPYNTGYVKDL
jgi:RNA polymerase II subunit A small phosphatase-like protein